MTNFKISAKDAGQKIIQYWRVETYHYYLEMLLEENNYIAYKEPFSIAIFRSFTINLYQFFLNRYKNEKVLPTGKTTMVEIKRNCKHSSEFSANLFELEAA